MLSHLALALLLVLTSASTNDCLKADEYECYSSLCPNYYYVNASCIVNSSSTCTAAGHKLYNGQCYECSTLNTSSTC